MLPIFMATLPLHPLLGPASTACARSCTVCFTINAGPDSALLRVRITALGLRRLILIFLRKKPSLHLYVYLNNTII